MTLNPFDLGANRHHEDDSREIRSEDAGSSIELTYMRRTFSLD
jgi:hypothetical protein